MANLAEANNFDAGIYQLETGDPVLGGPGGIANAQAQALANRTNWLKQNHAPLQDPAFIGNPTTPTPPQFDNDTSLASTAFVQRALGNRQAASVLGNGAATVLTAAQVGSSLVAQGGTVTLPALAAVPVGASFELGATSSATLNTAAVAEKIQFDGSGTNSVASMALAGGETLHLVSIGTAWFAFGGSAQLPRTPGFGISKTTPGWAKLPSGLVIQWGTGQASQAGWGNAFPLAFPTGCVGLVGQHIGTDGTVNVISGNISATTFTLITNYAASAITANWIAVGY